MIEDAECSVPDLFTIDEVAAKLHVSKRWCRASSRGGLLAGWPAASGIPISAGGPGWPASIVEVLKKGYWLLRELED